MSDEQALFSQLSPQELAFIDKNGQHYSKIYGIPRIGGRILGLLMLSPRAVTIEEIGVGMQVSHGSVSTNLRLLMVLGLVDKVTLPGSRCDYYQFSSNAWNEILKKRLESIVGLRTMAVQAMETLQPEGIVLQRFQEMSVWIEMAQIKYNELLAEWRQEQSQKSQE